MVPPLPGRGPKDPTGPKGPTVLGPSPSVDPVHPCDPITKTNSQIFMTYHEVFHVLIISSKNIDHLVKDK